MSSMKIAIFVITFSLAPSIQIAKSSKAKSTGENVGYAPYSKMTQVQEKGEKMWGRLQRAEKRQVQVKRGGENVG